LFDHRLFPPKEDSLPSPRLNFDVDLPRIARICQL
jgi:hypothetical protein